MYNYYCPPPTTKSKVVVVLQHRCSPSGHYCTGGAETAEPGGAATQDETGEYTGNGRCPVGHYCPAGSVQPEPCPKGG